MPSEEEKSQIEKLNESLYSRNAPDVRTRRKLRFDDLSSDVQPSWNRDAEIHDEIEADQQPQDHSMSFFTKLLIASILFCLVAVGAGAYLFFNGANLISADNIDITVNGPVSVPGGVPVSFDLSVTNNNTVDLQNSDITVTYPPGATDPKNPTQELNTYHETLGDIARGQTVRRTVQAILFGEENTQKQIKVEVGYTVKGSTSSFTAQKSYDILINSSPVNLTVSSFKEITAGQEFDIKINVKSNSQDTLKNVLLSTTYPFGFSFISSNFKPLSDNATWRLGNISPGEERTISIHGKLQGENEDVRVFHVGVGSQSSRNPSVIGTEYMSVEQEIAIKKPFITVGISLDGNQGTQDVNAEFNQPVRVEVSWFNNLPSAVTDAQITLKLSGSAYDRSMVQPGSGYFRSSTDEIIWSGQTTPELASIGPGESGTVTFSVVPRDLSLPGKPVTSPTITMSANVTGKRSQESGVPQSLTSVVTRSARVSTSLALSGQVVRTVGPFVNSGPIPPQVDKKTTYTIQWTIDNSANSIHNAQVTAKLPTGVSWLNQVSPSAENVSYDHTSGIVTWNAGSVGTYTAVTGQRKQVAFQVSLEPNVNQIGTAPILVEDSTLTALDDFTGATVNSAQSYLTTRFSTDPSYRAGQENVIAK